jgi:ribosomal protein S18 acetylase RimI-like enzyme
MTALVIRPASPRDAEAVARVHTRTWRVAYAGIMPQPVLDALSVPERTEKMRTWLADPAPTYTWLLAIEPGEPAAAPYPTADGSLAGFVCFGPYRIEYDEPEPDPSVGQVLALYVDPDRWGRGAGRALLDAVVARLVADGHTEIKLWVLEANVRSRRFYERYGFVADGTEAVYRPFGFPDITLVEMRYSLRI